MLDSDRFCLQAKQMHSDSGDEMQNLVNNPAVSGTLLADAVIEEAPLGVVVASDRGEIVIVNRKAEELFGYLRHELLGRSIEILVPPASRTKHEHYRDEFAETQQSRTMGAGRDLFGLHKDGNEFPIEIGLNKLLTDEGTYVISSIIDISVRKEMEQALVRSESRLQEVSKALEAEMAAAANIQKQAHESRLPELPDWKLAAGMRMFREAGGDFYGAFASGDVLYVWLGDVSGKGLASALLSSSAQALMRYQAQFSSTDPSVISKVGRTLYGELTRNTSFITLLWIAIDTKTGESQVVDAGHSHLRVRRADGSWEEFAHADNMPLGCEEIPDYSPNEFAIAEGDLLMIFSDGLVENSDIADCAQGTARLQKAVDRSLQELGDGGRQLNRVVGDVMDRIGSRSTIDDATLVLVKRGQGF